MSDAIRLSVALVTRNRPESLARCLASLQTQDTVPFEIIVSDDSDAPQAIQSRTIAERAGARWQSGPHRGLYANRNAAALACTGTHIRTMDDDHTFPPGHFARCLEAVTRDPKAIWTTGEICLLDGHQHGIAETANQLHPSGLGGPVSNLDDNWSIADGSTIYPASVFQRGARMLEDFSYGPTYLEFGALLYHHGYRSRCLPGVHVEHHTTRETLDRGARDFAASSAWLFASLCYNLHFRPNYLRAAKYALAVVAGSKDRVRLIQAFPHLLSLARERWSTSLAA